MKIKSRVNAVQILDEVERAKYVVNVLMAHGDGGLKRKLNILGDYGKHRDEAAAAVIDNAFFLAVALSTMGPLGKLRFSRRVKELDKVLAKAYPKEGGLDLQGVMALAARNASLKPAKKGT